MWRRVVVDGDLAKLFEKYLTASEVEDMKSLFIKYIIQAGSDGLCKLQSKSNMLSNIKIIWFEELNHFFMGRLSVS